MGATGSALMTSLGVDGARISSAIVDEMSEYVAVFDQDLHLIAINRSLHHALGYPIEDLLGISAVDIIASEHRERAALMVGLASRQGVMPGVAPYGLVKADGSILVLQITGVDLSIDGHSMLVVIGRPANDTIASDLVLDRLLDNYDLDLVLAPLLDLFGWQLAGSGVAITWTVDGIRHSVSTGLPGPLAGIGDLHPDGAWARALRLGEPVLGAVDQLLDAKAKALARELGFGQVWVEPVATTSDTPDAMITVLGSEHGYSPLVHRHGVDEARRYLAVVLRWNEGLRRLEDAARSDDLTGLANRRAFFSALSTSQGGGAILFADLDGFKAVNDRWGHAIGDDVLTEVGHRLTASVAPGACVARVGGDEFAVILGGATIEDATTTAERIRQACAEPFYVHGDPFMLGISVGVAHDPIDLSAAALHAADRAQYADKRRRITDS